MRSRIATGVGGLAVVCMAPMAAAQTGDIARTPSGRPDLSGTYDVGTLTPMQRPTELGEKMSLSDEEAAAFGARRTAALATPLTTAMDGRRRKTVHTARRPEERPKDASHSSTFTECTAAMLTLPSFAGPTSARSVTRTVRMRFSVGTGARRAPH